MRHGERNKLAAFVKPALLFTIWCIAVGILYHFFGAQIPISDLNQVPILLIPFSLSFCTTLILYKVSLENTGIELDLKQLAELYFVIASLDLLTGQALPVGEIAGATYVLSLDKNADKKKNVAGWAGLLVLSSIAGFSIVIASSLAAALVGIWLLPVLLLLFLTIVYFSVKTFFDSVKLKIDFFGHDLRIAIPDAEKSTIIIALQGLLFLISGITFAIFSSKTLELVTIVRNLLGYCISFIMSTGISFIPGAFETINLIQTKLGIIQSPSIIASSAAFQLVFFWLPIFAGVLLIPKLKLPIIWRR